MPLCSIVYRGRICFTFCSHKLYMINFLVSLSCKGKNLLSCGKLETFFFFLLRLVWPKRRKNERAVTLVTFLALQQISYAFNTSEASNYLPQTTATHWILGRINPVVECNWVHLFKHIFYSTLYFYFTTSEGNIVFTPLHLSDRLSDPSCPVKSHISPNLLILILNFSDKLKDEVFLYVLRLFLN